jgi:hypothetical protein
MGAEAVETLVKLTDLPQSSVGAPQPVVYANEHRLMVAYYLLEGEASEARQSGVIVFERVHTHVFGMPNDEALRGHRLAPRGLQAYSFYEVKQSRWTAELCRRNRVHARHSDSMYSDLRHFIATFHDTTLEVAARDLTVFTDEMAPIDCISTRLGRRGEWD